jgi:16S rRNA (guanine1207-N2)-methyltransferase
MAQNPLETLFLPLNQGLRTGSDVAVLNALPHPALSGLSAGNTLYLQQYFKPYVQGFQSLGLAAAKDLPAGQDLFDAVFINLPKNIDEARYFLACGLKSLRVGGTLIAAAANDAGGGRLKKIFAEFELQNCCDIAKNKSRVVWGVKGPDGLPVAAQKALESGAPQLIMNGAYMSQPGIFGWDKIDRGSMILLQHLKADLQGKGADFGCGYGYLSHEILQQFPGIKTLHCIDADWRSVDLCRQNLERLPVSAAIEYHWEDLTKRVSGVANLDWIIMNPPFHEGKKTDIGIGQGFIDTAFQTLHKGGALWMVANAQLPYELALESRFSSVERIFEGSGFKVFCARK